LVIQHPQSTFSLTIALGSLLDGFDLTVQQLAIDQTITFCNS
jgi:hypothetical protein